MTSAKIQDKLQALLLETEQHPTGSVARTQSLEKIRSMLLDRGSTMKASSSPKEIGGSVMMRGYSGSRAAMSPDGDSVLLDDAVFHNSHNDTSLHSIPEVGGHHSASIWNESAFHDEHVHDDSFGTTFMMDDVGEDHHQAQSPPTSIPIGTIATAAAAAAPHATGRAPINEPPLQGGVSKGAPHAAASSGGGAGGAMSAAGGVGAAGGGGTQPQVTAVRLNVGKPPAVPSSPARATGKPPSKAAGQMSNLAKEEQAAIPHLPAGTTESSGAAPLVPMLLEPDKRLSHKEVEQRRREKAKQYFDELRALLPFGSDSAKFDKNAILHHSIVLLKNLMAELAQEESSSGSKLTPGQAAQSDYRCSFDVNRQPMCFAGLDSRLTDANSAFCTLSGYARMEVTGISLFNCTAPADLEAVQQHWNQLAQPGAEASVSYKCRFVRKDGQQILCNIDLVCIQKQGKPFGFVVSANPTQ